MGPRGCVVLVHGLNTTPRVMDDVADVLDRDGYRCAHVDLHGSTAGGRHPDDVLARWFGAYDNALDGLRTDHPDMSVSAVGFSLGALLPLLRSADPDAGSTGRLRRLVVWAPPLVLSRPATAVRLLLPARRLGLSLPSATPRAARARRATPLAEYAALLHLSAAAGRLGADTLDGVPTLVLLDRGDPLVSYAGVRTWVARRGLEHWAVEAVQDRPRMPRGHRHLLVNRESMGATAWRSATARMLAHLS